MTTTHTPTPWYQHTDDKMHIMGSGNWSVADVNFDSDRLPEANANAALICKAVNNYWEMVSILREVAGCDVVGTDARALLAKLGEV
jgi:hypothetical protein